LLFVVRSAKRGATAEVTGPETRNNIMNPFDPLRKVMHVDEAAARHGAQSGTVFTNGVFDLLQRGHAAYLAEARRLGDRLIVGIQGDESARASGSGTGRPVHSEGDRAFLVAAFESVDAVVIFNEPTPIALLARLKPFVYVMAGDRDMSRMAETALVQSWGGHALALPYFDGFSTTALVERIRGEAASTGSMR
jgi:rfaE bifunctional protein nucleotidyltransferase chain/domain